MATYTQEIRDALSPATAHLKMAFEMVNSDTEGGKNLDVPALTWLGVNGHSINSLIPYAGDITLLE